MSLDSRIAAVAVVALLVGSTVGLAVGGGLGAPSADEPAAEGDDGPTTAGGNGDVTAFDGDPSIDTFDSSDEFAEYLSQSRSRTYFRGGIATPTAARTDVVEEEEAGDDAARSGNGAGNGNGADGAGGGDGGVDRHSETNVQEAALDEPDILKTDGETIYYGDRRRGRHGGSTHVLDASDRTDPTVAAEITDSGELLLAGDSLVVFEHDAITGYDVSDPSEPAQTWSTAIDGRLEAARLYDGDVYLVVESHADPDEPCPIEPLGPRGPAVDCTEVHYPSEQDGADAVYTTMRVDPATGEVDDAVTFLGSSRTTATYVSENAVYLTYADSPSEVDIRLEFLLSEGSEYLDERTIERLEALRGYDLSEQATRIEMHAILEDWRAGLDREERRTVEENLEDAWEAYATERLREFTRTGVVKVDIDGNLGVDAAGAVPGTPLNQWSLDEHDGHLRVATTLRAPSVDSENDLYVLDEDLETVGSVTGMGVDERIYSVRYEGDTAYVVTFREIDPFHVIDVSDPTDPTLQGELKLPGFSTYMHPLGEDRVLGIGEEDGNVKAVIFDASDPENPVVEDDAILEDRWSAVRESHNAFLIDERHGVFFLPGSEGGHVFAYEDGLERVTTVQTDGPALRAMYLDDYLYVFGEDELVVVDETTWEEEAYVDLR